MLSNVAARLHGGIGSGQGREGRRGRGRIVWGGEERGEQERGKEREG